MDKILICNKVKANMTFIKDNSNFQIFFKL